MGDTIAGSPVGSVSDVPMWLKRQLARLGLRIETTSIPLAEAGYEEQTQSILLVDDTPANLDLLRSTLKPMGHKLLAATTGEAALAITERENPNLILLDIMMPGMDGFEVCRRIKASPKGNDIAIIFCSALGETSRKVDGLAIGAIDYITKPFDPEEVIARVGSHLALQQLTRTLNQRNRALAQELAVAKVEKNDSFERLQWMLEGDSKTLEHLKMTIDSAAGHHDPVLLTGAPDCGAEAVARAIHQQGQRAGGAFVTMDCARPMANPAVELSLKAKDAEESRFYLAHGGTLFIHHAERLDPQSLEMLVTFLEQHEGGQCPVDTRLVISCSDSAQNDFKEIVGAQIPVQLRVPNLRGRKGDIIPLVKGLLHHIERRLGRSGLRVDDEGLELLASHKWPGNFRELETVLNHSVANSTTSTIKIDASLLQDGIPIGRFRLSRRIGKGGFGEVWKAKHESLACPAAVKILNKDAKKMDERAMERFSREARITAQLTSPHTVKLLDFGMADDGRLYYAMELLDGLSLGDFFEVFGTMPPARLAKIFLQACYSLAEAHESGLVHRDIKPDNLLMCRCGTQHDFLKVVDFGLVHHTDPAQERLTAESLAVGTPGFIAPEMIIAEDTIGTPADMYCLSSTAYFLLTGRPVFEDRSMLGLVKAHADKKPTPVQEIQPLLPDILSQLVDRGLEKEPAKRPTAKEWIAELAGDPLLDDWTDEDANQWWDQHRPRRRLAPSPGEG